MIYRSATVIVQNSTRQPLVTAGFGVVRGNWDDDQKPDAHGVIEVGETATYRTISEEVGGSTEGFIRFTTTYGSFHLNWKRPWVGALRASPVFEREETTRMLHVHSITDEDEPMAPVIVFMVHGSGLAQPSLTLDAVIEKVSVLGVPETATASKRSR